LRRAILEEESAAVAGGGRDYFACPFASPFGSPARVFEGEDLAAFCPEDFGCPDGFCLAAFFVSSAFAAGVAGEAGVAGCAPGWAGVAGEAGAAFGASADLAPWASAVALAKASTAAEIIVLSRFMADRSLQGTAAGSLPASFNVGPWRALTRRRHHFTRLQRGAGAILRSPV
jgi:hypothetical protein